MSLRVVKHQHTFYLARAYAWTLFGRRYDWVKQGQYGIAGDGDRTEIWRLDTMEFRFDVQE